MEWNVKDSKSTHTDYVNNYVNYGLQVKYFHFS